MLRGAIQVVWKDLVVEARAREIFVPMLFFATLVVLVASFALAGGDAPPADTSGGIVWIALAFAGSLGIGRAFERERENETFSALLLSMRSRSSVLLGKLITVVVFMLIVELVVVFLVGLLFSSAFAERPGRLALLLGLGTIGYASAGSLFAAALTRSRSRDVLLGVLLYPIAVPILLAGAKGTAALLESPPILPVADLWIRFLLALDTIFLTIAFWAFGPLSEDA